MIRGLCKVEDPWLGEGVLIGPGNGDAGPFLMRQVYNEMGGWPAFDSLTANETLQAAWIKGRQFGEAFMDCLQPGSRSGADEALLYATNSATSDPSSHMIGGGAAIARLTLSARKRKSAYS